MSYNSGCSDLPFSWYGVTTDTQFPVSYGTEITVKCTEGYSKSSGNDMVTCRGGAKYRYTAVPICKAGDILEYIIQVIQSYRGILSNWVIKNFKLSVCNLCKH